MTIQQIIGNLRCFSMPFAWYAMIVAVFVSLCAALMGVILVLKRYSMIGDGLSHVAFGASAISAALGKLIGSSITQSLFGDNNNTVREIFDTAIVLGITVLVAVLLLRSSNRGALKGDTAIAMLSAGSLAIGYLLLNITGAGSSNLSGDVCSSLFGSTSIIMLNAKDVVLCVSISVAIIAVFFLLYNKIFSVTFDERFAAATGIKTEKYNLIIGIMSAVVIVTGMKMAGALLIAALVIFPATSAMRLFKSFKHVIIASACISVTCSTTGGFLAIVFGTPVGASIVLLNILVFFAFSVVRKIRG